MMKPLLRFLITLSLLIVRTSENLQVGYDRQHFCGTRLVLALSLLCETYNIHSEVGSGYSQQYGIIETCCLRPCSRNVLSTYCGTLRKNEKEPSGYSGKKSKLRKNKNRRRKSRNKQNVARGKKKTVRKAMNRRQRNRKNKIGMTSRSNRRIRWE